MADSGQGSGCRDSFTQITVAVIGVLGIIIGTVLGIVLERSEILDQWLNPPQKLIADFNSPDTGLAPNRVTQRSNSVTLCDVRNGQLVIANDASTEWQRCALELEPRRQETLTFDKLGSTVADFSAGDANELEESNLYHEMVTYFEHSRLEVHCGIRHENNELSGFMSVRLFVTGDPAEVTCPPSGLDTDHSDGVCETFYETLRPLEPNETYTFELRANPADSNEFQCFVDSKGTQFFVDTAAANLGNDLLAANFERYIVATYLPGSTMKYTVDNVYHIR